jgi:hydrogenase/urease accessory protein HupE
VIGVLLDPCPRVARAHPQKGRHCLARCLLAGAKHPLTGAADPEM